MPGFLARSRLVLAPTGTVRGSPAISGANPSALATPTKLLGEPGHHLLVPPDLVPPDSEGPAAPSVVAAERPSFLKLAMRNMVRKGRQSLLHFGLTAVGLTGFLVLIAWLGRPQLPG
jgi:hypothetical protein